MSEGLFIKAQMEIAAGNTSSAKAALRRILETAGSDDVNRRWARSMLDDLVKERDSTH